MDSSFMWESKIPHFCRPAFHRDKSLPGRPRGSVMGIEYNATPDPKPLAKTTPISKWDLSGVCGLNKVGWASKNS